MRLTNNVAMAIDIGGSKGLVGLVGLDGRVLAKQRFVWEGELTGPRIEARIIREAMALMARHPDVRPDVIGATIPGLANADAGLWVEASFSGIRNLPIAADLTGALNLPCFVDNDANAAALAEKRYGGAGELTNFLYVTVSNGIGGAAFCDGRLLRGQDNNAIEIGHCLAVEDGRPCGCGNRGCLEMHASGVGLSRNYRELGGLPLDDGGDAQCADIAQRARAGEKAALATFDLEGRYLGKALAAACNLLNPQRVFIGGGVSLVFDLFEQPLNQELHRHLYRRANAHLTVCRTALGYDGALLGAAATAFSRGRAALT